MGWPFKKKRPEPEPQPVEVTHGYIPTVTPEPEPVVATHDQYVPEPEPEPKKPEPSVAIHEAIRISHTDHLLHIRAHHEQTVRLRNMPHGPERDEAIRRHEKDAEDIRSYMRIHRPDEELRARFWQLQDRIEWLQAQPRTAETVAEIDELSKESTHIVHALPRADGSSGGPVGYTGPRPSKNG